MLNFQTLSAEELSSCRVHLQSKVVFPHSHLGKTIAFLGGSFRATFSFGLLTLIIWFHHVGTVSAGFAFTQVAHRTSVQLSRWSIIQRVHLRAKTLIFWFLYLLIFTPTRQSSLKAVTRQQALRYASSLPAVGVRTFVLRSRPGIGHASLTW